MARLTNRAKALKELNRLTKGVKANIRKGYFYSQNYLPELPKRVTQKYLDDLKKLKPLDLALSKTTVLIDDLLVNKTTGELITAEDKDAVLYEAVGITPPWGAENRYFDESAMVKGVISYFKQNALPLGRLGTDLISWIDELIMQNGEISVAQMLIDGPEFEKLFEYMSRKGYGSEQNLVDYQAEMLEYLPNFSPSHLDIAEDYLADYAYEQDNL